MELILSDRKINQLENTGERMLPSLADRVTFWEHVYRYQFAKKFVRNKSVLDIACGEGYGSASMKGAGAKVVFGIDIDEKTCHNAKFHYAESGAIISLGSAEQIPLSANSIDVIVSFETIEHLENASVFLEECARVLAPDGKLIISTPNRKTYRARGNRNPYHTIEFDWVEWQRIISAHFRHHRHFTQRPVRVAPWSLRTLATPQSWMRSIPGYWRFKQLIQARANSPIWNTEMDLITRDETIELILRNENSYSYLLNPFLVRPWASCHREEPYYFVSVVSN